jgi:hypothetical protein
MRKTLLRDLLVSQVNATRTVHWFDGYHPMPRSGRKFSILIPIIPWGRLAFSQLFDKTS